jgi:hypothetical protein
MDLTEAIAALYAGPLDAFTRSRDALAKQLRGDGDREAADRVRRLRKPSVTAWALNRARAADPERVSELLVAGERLRDAQDGLFGAGSSEGSSAGSGGRDALRTASAGERRLVDALVAAAEAELAAAGHTPTPTLSNRLFATLRAVSSDDEARGALSSGTLARDYEIADFGFGLALDIKLPDAPAPPEAPTRDEQAITAARSAVATAQSELEHTEAGAVAARQTVADAEQALTAAQAALSAAADATSRAADRVAELTAELDRLEA